MIDLIHGDCLIELKNMLSESVHSFIIDIPYGINISGWDVKHDNKNSALLGASPSQKTKAIFKTRGKPKNGWSNNDRNIADEFQFFCGSYLKECFRILKPCGSIIAFTGRQYQHRFIIAGENEGFIFKDSLAWDKQIAPFKAQRVGQVIGARNGDYSDEQRLGCLAPVFEPIVWLFKPYPIGTTITDCYLKHGTGTFSSEYLKTNLISFNSRIKEKKHETEKPLGLMEILIKTFTLENQIVCDCFMGSGTTGAACVKTNRSFIGIEKDESNFKIAKKRILTK